MIAKTFALLVAASLAASPALADQEPIEVAKLPKMVTPDTLKAIADGAAWLRRQQRQDGSWGSGAGGGAGEYPVAMTSLAALALCAAGSTPTRGTHSRAIREAILFLLKHQLPSGLLTSPNEQRAMYGHGFAMTFLGNVYGNTADRKLQKQIHACLAAAVKLTVQAQSDHGGWYYTADARTDEGSVTVTQMQGLRSAANAGVIVPQVVWSKAVNYLKICQQADGGICYSYSSRGSSRPAISAAAVACMYSAGAYDDPIAFKALEYCKKMFGNKPSNDQFFFYTNFYLAQVMYISGEKEWEAFYPQMRQAVLTTHHRQGDYWGGSGWGAGPVYGTATAIMILAMPYKHLPLFHR